MRDIYKPEILKGFQVKLHALAAIIFTTTFIQDAFACTGHARHRYPLLSEVPALESAPHIAEVEISRLLGQNAAEVTIVKALKGLEGVQTMVVVNGESSCDLKFDQSIVGKRYIVAGSIRESTRGQVRFYGLWRNGKPVSEAEMSEDLQ